MTITKPLSVLIIEPASDLGGVSQYILKIMRHMDPSFKVFLAVPPDGKLLEDKLFQHSVTFLPLDFHRGPFGFFRSVRQLKKIVRDNQISIVHAHTLRGGSLAAAALWFSFVPLVYTPHGLRFLQKGSAFSRWLFLMVDRITCVRVQALVALSPKEKEEMLRFKIKKSGDIFIAPSCIDEIKTIPGTAPPGAPSPLDGKLVVGMVGRMTGQKDPFGFLTVAKMIKEKIPQAMFVWVGGGELQASFLKRAEEAGLSASLIFAGHVDHAVAVLWMAYFDIFLFTSRYEGLPAVLLEAFSIGVPIVASNVGSVSDIIKEGETGFLFDRDDYRMACDSVLAAHNLSSTDRKAMEKRQREIIRRTYAPESRLAEGYMKIYRSFIPH